jgi:hypothetical protein
MKYTQYLSDKFNKFGLLFNDCFLSQQFVPYFESGQRIIVQTRWETVRGYVGVTTGYKPSFLLLPRKDSISSPILLSDEDKIIGTVNKYLYRKEG